MKKDSAEVRGNVTRWLECLFNILPFTAVKTPPSCKLNLPELAQNNAKY